MHQKKKIMNSISVNLILNFFYNLEIEHLEHLPSCNVLFNVSTDTNPYAFLVLTPCLLQSCLGKIPESSWQNYGSLAIMSLLISGSLRLWGDAGREAELKSYK